MISDGVRFRLLGPFEAVVDGRIVELTARQRALCTLLLLDAGRTVSVDRIVDQLWEDRPPQSGAARVRALVTEVRRALDDAGRTVLTTRSPGYALCVGSDGVDVSGFEESVRRGNDAEARRDWAAAAASYRDALALWRGDPISDLSTVAAAVERRRLEELRLGALEGAASAEIEEGEHRQAVARLLRITAEHPLRERPHALLMRALQRDGRVAEALDVYAALRRRTVDELGVEPSAELKALHLSLLGADDRLQEVTAPAGPAERVIPRQLPTPPRHFVAREAELERLETYRREGEPLVLIVGPAGIGKSALALHWTGRTAPQFPDGQLFLDMRGFDDAEPMTPEEALPVLLQGLGCAPRDIPLGLAAQTALYRTQLAGRRVLVVLDDVADPSYVTPLLPTSAGSLAVVTSRSKLGALVTLAGARRITCGLLEAPDALRLLGSAAAAEAVAAEPEAARRLVDLCDGLPLALCIARSWLDSGRPGELGAYVDELTGIGRLARLHADHDAGVAVRAALDLSYNSLADEPRRIFRALGLLPGTGRSAAAAGAAVGIDAGHARELLRRAEGVHLVQDQGGGRWSWHDLVHEYAGARARQEDDEESRKAALERILAHYLHSVVAAARISGYYLPRLELPQIAGAGPREFGTREEAAAWFGAEWDDLAAAVHHAAEHGPAHYAWRLVDALQDLFHHGRPLADWTRLASVARSAAERSGDEIGQACMSLSLGHARWRNGELREAMAEYERATAAARRARWTHGEAISLQGKGVSLKVLGRPREALPCYEQAIALYRSLGDTASEAVMMMNMASLNIALGRLDEADSAATGALDMTTKQWHLRSVALVSLARIRQSEGRLDAALPLLRESLLLARESDFPYAEALTLEALGRVHADAGRDRAVRLTLTDALATARLAENRNCQVDCLVELGHLALRSGLRDEACRLLDRARDLTDAAGYPSGAVGLLFTRAAILGTQGDIDEALPLLERAVRLAEGTDVLSLPRLHGALAALLLARGDAAAAIRAAEQATALARGTGQSLSLARACLGLAEALEAAGRAAPAEAARGEAQDLFDQVGTPPTHRSAVSWRAAADQAPAPTDAWRVDVPEPAVAGRSRTVRDPADYFAGTDA
ncbi:MULTISPECIES: BTAD domain-containing putative transcriptional regulator [unclassified Streptomyces]|uniref:AfsR/SARP family transcriptional regulator n=1 Tax=unclassified Streptomyces TaxID=2593676 RepID=UPI0036E7C24F